MLRPPRAAPGTAPPERPAARPAPPERPAARPAPPTDLAFPAALLAFYGVIWIFAAMDPVRRDVWFIENLLPVAAVLALAVTARRFRFSDTSYSLLFAFLLLHTIGAHFTYAETPVPIQMDGGRNPFDRLVHFAFGLLLARPLFELYRLLPAPAPRGARTMIVGLVVVLSVLYEILEFWTAELAPGTGVHFLATQGDRLDPLKDVAAAVLGAVFSMSASWLQAKRVQRPAGPFPRPERSRPTR